MTGKDFEKIFDEAMDLREKSSLWSAGITGQVFKSVRRSRNEKAARIFSYAFSFASAAVLVLAIMTGMGDDTRSRQDDYMYLLTGNQGVIDYSSGAFYEGMDLYIDYAAAMGK